MAREHIQGPMQDDWGKEYSKEEMEKMLKEANDEFAEAYKKLDNK